MKRNLKGQREVGKKKAYNPEFDPPLLCVLGRRGSGKSSFVVEFIKKLKRKVIFDPREEYTGGPRFKSLVSLYDYLKKAGKGPVTAIYSPPLLFGSEDADATEDGKRAFNLFCEIVFNYGQKTGFVWMIADEMDRFTGPGPRIPKWFDLLCNEGRHAKVAMIGISRRPAKIPKDFIENSHVLILFHLQGGAVDYLIPTIGKEWAKKLPNLKPLEYIRWSESETPSFNTL